MALTASRNLDARKPSSRPARYRTPFSIAPISQVSPRMKKALFRFSMPARNGCSGLPHSTSSISVTPADISDPQELIARAASLSLELDTPIAPGFEALVFKASRGIEDIYELTYIRKDGSRVPAIVSVTALRDAQKNIIGYLLIGTDNTARKQVEAVQALLDQRLRDSTGRLQAILDTVVDGVFTIDEHGNVETLNPAGERIFGYTAAQVVGHNIKMLLPGDLPRRTRRLSRTLPRIPARPASSAFGAKSWEGARMAARFLSSWR